VTGNLLQTTALIASLVITPASVLAGQAERNPANPPNVVRKAGNALQAAAINRVEATYTSAALMARASGAVFVEVTVDEGGAVVSARALSGHALLKESAVEAARGWTFKPTTWAGKPAKVVGTLRFDFRLPDYILRDPVRTIRRLKQRIALYPKDPGLQYQLGRAYEENDEDMDALRAYERAVELKPDYGDAQAALGAVNLNLSRFDAALVAYNRAVLLRLTPESKAAAYKDIGLIHFIRDEFREAVEPFKQSIALAPEASVYLKLGLTYLKLGDPISALDQYRLLKQVNSILAQQLLKEIEDAQQRAKRQTH
jgi:TonB family protein